MDIWSYIIRRLGQGLLLVIGVSVLLFFLVRLMPGDPIAYMVGSESNLPEVHRKYLLAKWGLDKPFALQYFYWAKAILLEGNLGISIRTGQSVTGLILSRLPYTLALNIIAMLTTALIAIPLGLLAAFKHNKFIDRAMIITTVVLQGVPGYLLALLLVLIFAINLKWFPISGYEGPAYLVLPVMSMTILGIGGLLRYTRSEVLETYREKYVTTAYAKGLKQRSVLFKHVLRNSLIPVSVIFFLSLPWMIGGSVIIEQIFSLPGTGQLIFTSISTRDYPVVQGVVLIVSVLTVIANTLGDVMTAILDPRIRSVLS